MATIAAGHELAPGVKLGFENPKLAFIDGFTPAATQAGWELDVSSAERQRTAEQLLDVLDTPLSRGTLPGLTALHKESVPIYQDGPRGFMRDSIDVGRPDGRLAQKIHRESGTDKETSHWLVPVGEEDLIILPGDGQTEVSAMIGNRPASRAELEAALNSVGSFFKEARLAAQETTSIAPQDTKTQPHSSFLENLGRLVGHHLHPK